MGVIRFGMLSALVALGGIAAADEVKIGLCEGGWIETASLEDITEKLEAGITCAPGQEPLLQALKEDAGIEKIRLLVADDRIARPSGPWVHFSPLHMASAHSSLEIIKMMLDRGYKVNDQSATTGASPLHLAAAKNPDPMVIDLLVESGAKMNPRDNKGRMPVHMAASFNPRLEVLQALLDHGADTSSRVRSGVVTEPEGMLPFHQAVMRNPNKEIAEALYDRDLLEISINKSGDTPLMIAALLGDAEGVEYLLDKGADVNALNDDGGTALLNSVWASSEGRRMREDADHLSVISMLFDNGADLSAGRLLGLNLTLLTVNKLEVGILEELLDHGDSVDAECIAQFVAWRYPASEEIDKVMEKHGVVAEVSWFDTYTCYGTGASFFVINRIKQGRP